MIYVLDAIDVNTLLILSFYMYITVSTRSALPFLVTNQAFRNQNLIKFAFVFHLNNLPCSGMCISMQ